MSDHISLNMNNPMSSHQQHQKGSPSLFPSNSSKHHRPPSFTNLELGNQSASGINSSNISGFTSGDDSDEEESSSSSSQLSSLPPRSYTYNAVIAVLTLIFFFLPFFLSFFSFAQLDSCIINRYPPSRMKTFNHLSSAVNTSDPLYNDEELSTILPSTPLPEPLSIFSFHPTTVMLFFLLSSTFIKCLPPSYFFSHHPHSLHHQFPLLNFLRVLISYMAYLGVYFLCNALKSYLADYACNLRANSISGHYLFHLYSGLSLLHIHAEQTNASHYSMLTAKFYERLLQTRTAQLFMLALGGYSLISLQILYTTYFHGYHTLRQIFYGVGMAGISHWLMMEVLGLMDWMIISHIEENWRENEEKMTKLILDKEKREAEEEEREANNGTPVTSPKGKEGGRSRDRANRMGPDRLVTNGETGILTRKRVAPSPPPSQPSSSSLTPTLGQMMTPNTINRTINSSSTSPSSSFSPMQPTLSLLISSQSPLSVYKRSISASASLAQDHQSNHAANTNSTSNITTSTSAQPLLSHSSSSSTQTPHFVHHLSPFQQFLYQLFTFTHPLTEHYGYLPCFPLILVFFLQIISFLLLIYSPEPDMFRMEDLYVVAVGWIVLLYMFAFGMKMPHKQILLTVESLKSFGGNGK